MIWNDTVEDRLEEIAEQMGERAGCLGDCNIWAWCNFHHDKELERIRNDANHHGSDFNNRNSYCYLGLDPIYGMI